ncbi:CinA family protein [Leucobacter allii]|uniref:CinA family protein n=1 Tax=Leucobacter allii TaxID=2932247 RepID=UPI001FD026AB|nr:CinA family protein [Leucobacter allii]UOR02811.1 CinA family protein [Leucobacter allii]
MTDGNPGSTAELGAALVARAGELGIRVAVAESLTGGLLADAIVTVPGASRVFSGGIIAYDTALKAALLGVDVALLRERGPVDGDVAEQMAAGVRRVCAVPPCAPAAGAAGREADDRGAVAEAAWLGVATTGVAGPDPDPQTGQPAGTVWVAVDAGGSRRARRLQASGGRAEIRSATVRAALALALAALDPD